jgi:hypothetical protein
MIPAKSFYNYRASSQWFRVFWRSHAVTRKVISLITVAFRGGVEGGLPPLGEPHIAARESSQLTALIARRPTRRITILQHPMRQSRCLEESKHTAICALNAQQRVPAALELCAASAAEVSSSSNPRAAQRGA